MAESMHTHADGTRHHDHPAHGGRDRPDGHAPVVHSVVNHTVHDTVHHTVRGGPPVLDIGGDIGAMVVLMEPAAAGSELHLRSADESPTFVHTGVWTRPHGTATVTAAVFPELVAGTYWVLDTDGHDVRPIVIGGGELTEIDLRADTVADTVPIG
jgi:hypothetical protein